MNYEIGINNQIFDNYRDANDYYWYIINKVDTFNLIFSINNEQLIDTSIHMVDRHISLFQLIMEKLTYNFLNALRKGLSGYQERDSIHKWKQIYIDDFTEQNHLEPIDITHEITEIADFLTPSEVNRMCDLCTSYDVENGSIKSHEQLALEYMSMSREELIYQFETKYGYDYHVKYYDSLSQKNKDVAQILSEQSSYYQSWKNDLAIEKTSKTVERVLERSKNNV
ncbi:MAG: hypothetical protein LUF02_05975 [Erysipelotrichaceae bacterium]|nr:hypothetical protein [Erysipelotrichaceae bacterium]